MALFFSLMCSLGIPKGGGWLSQHRPCHSLAVWKNRSIRFRDSPSSPLRCQWRQQAKIPSLTLAESLAEQILPCSLSHTPALQL